MPRLKPGTIIPTDEEDAAITAAAALSDPDARPLTDEEWETVKPRSRVGRPPSPTPKVSTTIRFDADVLAAMKATGPGWQTRVNEIVRAYVETHPR
ncbi:BrnA antitoxin family protein [Thiocystis violacea]|uniref:BrnA antitoxin family protein n=1 Tax=Thiocystis violacea TaxID=13725 RepID=UPI0019052580|nr:BrnA antitoxin family protein [Thiocystis violacea]MBK1717148.1 hypothetical protein [Thiocystis violacea]